MHFFTQINDEHQYQQICTLVMVIRTGKGIEINKRGLCESLWVITSVLTSKTLVHIIGITKGNTYCQWYYYWLGGILLSSHLGGSIALAQVALHIMWICGLELSSICFKKCTHAMAMGYFLQYIAYDSQLAIIVLVPICSLCGCSAGIITFLYPLATKLVIVYAYWWQSCLLFMPLAPKPLFQSLYHGLSTEDHQLHQYQFFTLNLYYFQMVSL